MRKHLVSRAELTEAELDDLVERCRAGDEEAWVALWLSLAPFVERIAGSFRVTGPLSRSPDERCSIVARVMGELRDDGFRLLSELGERLAARDGSYRRWFATVAANSARKHVREHPDYVRPVEGEAPRWVMTSPLSDVPPASAPDPVAAIDAHRILADAVEELEPLQLTALLRWMQGEPFVELAVTLGLDGGAEAAERLVRSSIARLRYLHAGAGPCSTRPSPPSSRRGHAGTAVVPDRVAARGGRRGVVTRAVRRLPTRKKIGRGF